MKGTRNPRERFGTIASPRGSGMPGIVRDILNWNAPEEKGIHGRILRAIRSYLRWNRQLRLDPWMRYSPAVSTVQGHLGHRAALVLDVGSGPQGLARFLRRTIVGVDVGFADDAVLSPESFLLPVRASATDLPFRDRSFDAVVSMDMLEHIPRSDRSRVVSELLRVGRSLVVLGFPFGKEIVATVKRERPDLTLSWFSQEGLRGLKLRWKLQMLVPRDSRIYGLLFVPLYWLHARGTPRHAYRRVYVAQANGVQPVSTQRYPRSA
ncbi:class I SAM-dependent methyltransferase [Candidatus Bathyarchaeota archaeon]|nr:MAG: class I SAM-dependent methyltransferase [Candidatus Bathyarchaeota archaeon]